MPIKKTYRPGETILRENTLGNSAYIVESGKVEVSKNIGRQRVVFTTLEHGSIFGEMSLVDNSPRSATVTAIEKTVVTVLSKAGFQALLKQHRPLQSIFGVLAERLRETDKQVNPLKLSNFYFSLSSLIYHLARSTGQRNGEEIAAELSRLLDDSCTILAIEKELVEQVLNRMAFTKLVRIDKAFVSGIERRNLVIPDERKFRDWITFLRASSSSGIEGEDVEGFPEQLEETCQLLMAFRDNHAKCDPAKGKKSVGYDSYLQTVENMLNMNAQKVDILLKPYIAKGLLKFTFDQQGNTRRIVCDDSEAMERELSRLEDLRSYGKMAELLKSMASN